MKTAIIKTTDTDKNSGFVFGFWERTFRIIRVIRITVPYMDNIDTDIRLLEAEATWIIRVIRITVLYMDNMDTKYPGWPILGASANDTRKKDISDDGFRDKIELQFGFWERTFRNWSDLDNTCYPYYRVIHG
ncbi:hypothetical protein RIR_jg32106.t1 [Rhizophagus irregularis DAOM 181602=DAOM 197198]|nr:hypothetical protein RIR_jg32106.t1 [Rhizophagus irregularis DAOM 181602=DAOM 197198]